MRDAVREALERVRAVWPSLPVTGHTVDAYADACAGFEADVIIAGARVLVQEHQGMAAPKPAQLRAACVVAMKARGGVVEPRERSHDANGCEVRCQLCGTVTLYESHHDTQPPRLWPWHHDDCALRRADQPRDAQSRRIVWPQARNGGMYQAPAKVAALVTGHVNQVRVTG